MNVNKLEEKLIELGYECQSIYGGISQYIKEYDKVNGLIILIYLKNGFIDEPFCEVETIDIIGFPTRQSINLFYKGLKQAYKQLQEDLEVLYNETKVK